MATTFRDPFALDCASCSLEKVHPTMHLLPMIRSFANFIENGKKNKTNLANRNFQPVQALTYIQRQTTPQFLHENIEIPPQKKYIYISDAVFYTALTFIPGL